jgi:predicted RNase H-like HicB family nuclease
MNETAADLVDDLDLPTERVLTTWLSAADCHERLASFVKPVQRIGAGRDEPGQAADGWDLLGSVTEYGFELAQRVVASPLVFDRVASGVFEEAEDQTLIRFRMVFNPVAYEYLREDFGAIQMLDTLSSARWSIFDAEEVAFYLDNFMAILDARALSDDEPVVFETAEVSDDDAETWTVSAPNFESALDHALGVAVDPDLPSRKYVAVVEESDDGYNAYLPDLLGCVASGASLEELEFNLAGIVLQHVNGLIADGEELPAPRAMTRMVEVRS